MTEMTTHQRAGGMPSRLATRVIRLQRRLSHRLFADGDAFAREHRWTITRTSGRFGLGGRTYRDPRFDQRAAAAHRGEPPTSPGPRWSR